MRIRWRRLLTNPTTRVESREGDTTRLRVDGLVCDSVCAVRTADALRALPGVRSVTVDYDAGVATIEGEALPPESYERAVTRAVAGRGVRRVMEHLADALHLSRRDAAPQGSQPPPAASAGQR
jgi:heavy-metal-associated domain-containing protein